jgi:hypothetical protein
MSIGANSLTPPRAFYSGNGTTTAFPTLFRFVLETDIKVAIISAAGAVTLQTLTTDYTVDGGDGEEGTVTMLTAPASGDTLALIRNPTISQTVDLVEGGVLPAETVERQLDKATLSLARMENQISRCMRLADTDTQTDQVLELPLEADRASKFLAFDASGEPVASDGGIDPAIPVSVFAQTILDDTTAAAVLTTLGIPGGISAFAQTVIDDISAQAMRATLLLSAVTTSSGATYTALVSDRFIKVAAATTTGVALPAGAAGLEFFIQKTDANFTAITIDPNGAELIGGAATTTMHTQGETLHILWNGTAWDIIARTIPSVWVAYTPTFTGFGTAASINCHWKRVGDSIKVKAFFASGTPTATEARMSLPSGLTNDSTKLGATIMVGSVAATIDGASMTTVLAQSGAAHFCFGLQDEGVGNGQQAYNADFQFVSGERYSFIAECPISGWNG